MYNRVRWLNPQSDRYADTYATKKGIEWIIKKIAKAVSGTVNATRQ